MRNVLYRLLGPTGFDASPELSARQNTKAINSKYFHVDLAMTIVSDNI